MLFSTLCLQRRPSSAAAALMQQRIFAERHWTLGTQSRKTPAKIMDAIYEALRETKASWKKIAPYCLKARCVEKTCSLSLIS